MQSSTFESSAGCPASGDPRPDLSRGQIGHRDALPPQTKAVDSL